MFKRIAIVSALAFGISAMANIVLVTDAAAERYYDDLAERWVTYDPKKRGRYRKAPPRKFKRRSVSIITREVPGTIIIDTDKKFLYLVTSANRATRYGVGVGREGFGWNGRVKIGRKQEWPSWTPPPAMRARERAKGNILPVSMKGGINNPLGARAMYLYNGSADTLYRIHGTNEPWTIGLNMSSGCIRMVNKDVEDLYRRAKVGTKVVVIGPGRNSSSIYTQRGSFFGG